MNKQKIMQKINIENIFFFLIFIITTSIFIYQHSIYVIWDFQVYVLNAMYFLAEGNFFEPFRPPLMPFLISSFSLISDYKIAEYIYIIFVSSIFALSSFLISKELKLNKAVYYAISFTPFLLVEGLFNGTELLSFALIQFAIYFLIKDFFIAGLFLGLVAMSRYTALTFAPLIIFHMNLKKIILSSITFMIPISLWFIYNRIYFDNFLTSISDQYAQNVLFRGYMVGSASLEHFLILMGMIFIFFIIGLLYNISELVKDFRRLKVKNLIEFIEFIKVKKIEFIFLTLLAIALYNYFSVPLKIPRYLFYLLIPGVYYSYYGICILERVLKKIFMKNLKLNSSKKMSKFSYIMIGIIFIINISIATTHININIPQDQNLVSENLLNDLKSYNLSKCFFTSNDWPFLNYNGVLSGPLQKKENLKNFIDQGGSAIFFYPSNEPQYVNDKNFTSTLPIIEKNEKYAIISDMNKSCIKKEKYDETYMENLNKNIYQIH